MIEVEVHNSLRSFLRSHSEPYWPHHLTMARLVARALRLGRSALIQTGFPPGSHYQRYRISYLMPLLMWPNSAILVAPKDIQTHLLEEEIPRLQQWLQTNKPIQTYPCQPDFQGLLLMEPEIWLESCLRGLEASSTPFGDRLETGEEGGPIPVIIDGADDLEAWAYDRLTVCLEPKDWHELMGLRPDRANLIRDTRVQLTRALFQHPANPYECYLLEAAEQDLLQRLYDCLIADGETRPDAATGEALPIANSPAWSQFWQQWQANRQLRWAQIWRSQGSFSLHCAPLEVASRLSPIWSQQPVVLIGGAVDSEAKAPIYRQATGLPDLTTVKFSPDRQNEAIQLYVPDRLPLPNTPYFQSALIQELRMLLCMSASIPGFTVLIVGDVPLKAQVGAVLAAEFGSRVQVEKTTLDENGILVTGWEFWRQYQGVLPAPHLLAIATLPLPSLEDPLVAARVADYKEQRKDWFRLYLLPTALNELQRAIAPVRERQGVVALFDNRVLHRSYGHQVLAALSPLARIDYLDTTWLVQR